MKRIALICIMLLLYCPIFTQSFGKQELIKLLKQAQSEDPNRSIKTYEKALSLAYDLNLSEEIYQITHITCTEYENKGEFDIAASLYQKGIDYAQEEENLLEEVQLQSNLAIVEYYLGNWKQSVARFISALEINKILQRDEKVADAYANLGNLYQMEGKYVQGVEYYLEAIRKFEEIGLRNGVASTYFNLGNLYYSWGEDSLSYQYYQFAEKVFREEKDSVFLASTLTSKSINLFHRNELDSAEMCLDEALFLFRATNNALGIMHSYSKLGSLYNKQKRTREAEVAIIQALQMAEEQKSEQHRCWGLMDLAVIEKEKGNYTRASMFIEESMRIARKLGMSSYFPGISQVNSEIWEASGNFKQALAQYKIHTSLKDSLFTEKKNNKISELQTVYETEKKDKEIAILEKDVAVSKLRTYGIGLSLGTFLLIGFLLLNQQRIKRKKDQEIFSKEKRIQEQQVKVARMEREQMAQELSSQVLNFCRKNEFLQSLKKDLREFQEDKPNKEYKNLIKKIDRDLKGDNDWEAFLAAFKQVHPGFTYSLTHNYEGITSNEVRLASLMKMNLSGKEIASMLNISPESVKKARHRLRKKLNIEPELNLQDFLLRF